MNLLYIGILMIMAYPVFPIVTVSLYCDSKLERNGWLINLGIAWMLIGVNIIYHGLEMLA